MMVGKRLKKEKLSLQNGMLDKSFAFTNNTFKTASPLLVILVCIGLHEFCRSKIVEGKYLE